MKLIDLAAEAWAGVASSPVRSIFAAGGTIVGSATLIATLGLTSTVRSNVAGEFDEYATTTVVLDRDPSAGPVAPIAHLGDRLSRVPGVEGAAAIWEVDMGGDRVSAHLQSDPVSAPVYAVSPGAVRVLEPTMTAGQWLTDYASETNRRVAVVSQSLARDLHLAETRTHPAIFLNDVGFTVIGTYDDVKRSPEVLRGVVVPEVTAIGLWKGQPRATASIVIATRPGAAPVVAAQSSIAALPSAPRSLTARPVVDPRKLRGSVDQQVSTLFFSLAAVALLVGVLGAANTTTIGVHQRTAEIGVRRSLGASRTDVMLQFLGESCVVGVIGGVVGVSVGTLAVASAAWSWQLRPTMDLRLTLAGPAIGLVAGLLAGAYPSLRASRIEPVTALRGGE